MFTHPNFEVIPFEEIPLGRDVFLMGKRWLKKYESAMISMFDGGEYQIVGCITYAAVRGISESALEISWYPNIHDRFHEVSVFLPRDQVVVCVESSQYDEKTHIFVTDEWLDSLYSRPYSVFAMFDAIGVKKAIKSGQLSSDRLANLRCRIDDLAKNHQEAAFITYADSLLIKSQWKAGFFEKKIRYHYEPEGLVVLYPEIASIYAEVLDMPIYGVFVQGQNEYFDSSLLHISSSGNHVCLNSLGLPFAQLMAIDSAIRNAFELGSHPKCELYLEEHFFHSIRFRSEFDKIGQPKAQYKSPLTGDDRNYYYCSFESIHANLAD